MTVMLIVIGALRKIPKVLIKGLEDFEISWDNRDYSIIKINKYPNG